jgi:hypothetical protein
MIFKTDVGPNSDASWTVTSGGTDVDIFSNLGGARHNLLQDTVLVTDPPIAGLASIVIKADITDGTDLTTFGAVKDVAMWENVLGPNQALDLRRSTLKGFPAVLLGWQGSEPADGSTVSQTARRTRTTRTQILYREEYQIIVISSRAESDHIRREEGLEILDSVTGALTDRHMVDGYSVSNPAGIQIRNRYRMPTSHESFQRFYLYGITLAAMRPFVWDDTRPAPADWELTVIDSLAMQRPALPNQGDIPTTGDGDPGKPGVEADMT